MSDLIARARGPIAVGLLLTFAAAAHADTPGHLLAQRRGGRFFMPSKPANVESKAEIDALNKALKMLGETNRDYDGHREKAIAHIGGAIRHLELPNTKGKSNGAVSKALTGKPVAAKTDATPEAVSDESLRKAKTILFSVHHKLADHTASRGHIRADAEVRTAISELVAALTPSKPAPKETGAAK